MGVREWVSVLFVFTEKRKRSLSIEQLFVQLNVLDLNPFIKVDSTC